MGDGLALYLVGFYTQYRTNSHLGDTEYPVDDGPFDCVNKPRYHCPEQVDRAGDRCSRCRVSTNQYCSVNAHSQRSYMRNK